MEGTVICFMVICVCRLFNLRGEHRFLLFVEGVNILGEK